MNYFQKYALLDPEMIMSVPPMVAASCGIDALIHAWGSIYITWRFTVF